MALPACFADLNSEWFSSITGQINAVTSANELQNLVNQVYNTIGYLNSTIESQVTFMGPIGALLTAPTDLPSVITWVTDAITVFTQMYAPYAKLTAQLASITSEVSSLTSAVELVAAAKFPNAVITIPSVAAFCEL